MNDKIKEIMNIMETIEYGFKDKTGTNILNENPDWNFDSYYLLKPEELLKSKCGTSFLTFEENKKHYWFEHSWFKHKGIHEYNSKLELLLDVKNKFIRDHDYVNDDAPLFVYEYEKPKEHISCPEFYKYIETQKLV